MSLRIHAAPAAPSRRLGRAATFAFGAAIAASTACSGGVDDADGGATEAAAMIDSGGDGADAGDTDAGPMVDAGEGVDAGYDAGGIAPLYGGIPSDGGVVTRRDAGVDGGGGIAPAYGGSPPR